MKPKHELLLKKQYTAFLKSQSLWESSTSIDIPVFKLKNSIDEIKDITNICIPKNEVLGKRIELFFEHYIHTSPDYQLILKNLQIFRNKITIGELDFLISDIVNKQVLHVELVYKFYIYNPKISSIELEKWVGPNLKDSLISKITKLKKKQLPLLYQPETVSILKKIHIDVNSIEQQICYLANLFIPLDYKIRQIPIINNSCIQGFWIRFTHFSKKEYGTYFFNIPDKKDWILTPTYSDDWFTYEFVLEQIKNHVSNKKSPLLWIKNKEDILTKLFIVWW